MADALAHGADVNWVNVGQGNATPLIRATAAVRTPLTPPPDSTLELLLSLPWGLHPIVKDN